MNIPLLNKFGFIFSIIPFSPLTYHQKYRTRQPPCPTLFIILTPVQCSTSALSNHSASHRDYSVLCKVLSYAPTAPALPPGNPALSFIFPGQIANCIIVFFYLFRKAYPVYQILHFLIRCVKVCFCHDFSTQAHQDFLFPYLSYPINPHFPIGSFQKHVSGVYLPFLLFQIRNKKIEENKILLNFQPSSIHFKNYHILYKKPSIMGYHYDIPHSHALYRIGKRIF